MDFTDAKDYKQYLDMCNSEAYQQLKKFYHRKTLFDITGIARQENPHSNFIAWLLNPHESHAMNNFPIKRFLETICFAYIKYGQGYLNDKNPTYINYGEDDKTVVNDKLLFFDAVKNVGGEKDINKKSIDKDRELLIKKMMQGDYRITSCEIIREKTPSDNIPTSNKEGGKPRIDICIKLSIKLQDVTTKLLVIIENKVKSKEHDKQTNNYMSYLLKDNEVEEFDFRIPIFLYPATNNDLVNTTNKVAINRASSFPCENRLFLLLNYQYLLDGVISPCQTAYNDNPISEILSDYVACLGKSIEEPDETTGQRTDKGSKKQEDKDSKFTVLAVSREEKEWSIQLWNQHQKILLDVCDEFSLPMDERFLLRNESDEQFYRTVLSSVKNYLEEQKNNEGQTNLEEYLEKISNALKSHKVTFYVMQSNGELWEFNSGGRGNKTLGALGYVIIRQYIKNPTEPSSNGLSKDLLKAKLENIKHSWLRDIIVSKKELIKKVKKDGMPESECSRYYEDDLTGKGEWIGCPLSESGNNPVKPRKSAKKNNSVELTNSEYIYEESCLCQPGITNQKLFKQFYGTKGKKGYTCFHDFLHCFFVGNWFDDLKELGETDHKIKEKLDEINKSKKRINETFGAITIDKSDDDDSLYVARYWGEPTLDQLIKALKMDDYVSKDLSKIQRKLDFTIDDITFQK